MLKEDISGKEPRRQKVFETHEVFMLLGDNLSDSSRVFDGNSTEKRKRNVDSLKTKFGEKFIVLPNPIYGNKETHGIYGGIYN